MIIQDFKFGLLQLKRKQNYLLIGRKIIITLHKLDFQIIINLFLTQISIYEMLI
jgi:hypothetical protein